MNIAAYLWRILNFAHKTLFLFAINKPCFSIKWADVMGGKAWQDKNSRRKKVKLLNDTLEISYQLSVCICMIELIGL